MQQNLIPNPDFQNGLDCWEGTPVGVTLITTGARRIVMLTATETSAAICSDPIDVIPGATYIINVERALKGDIEVQILSANATMKVASTDEFVAPASPIRLQLTARKGAKAAVARVSLIPVGQRLMLSNIRSDVYLTLEGKPFRILASVTNTGSEPMVGAMASLDAPHHSLAEEHKATQRIPALSIGESRQLEWVVKGQSRAFAEFVVGIEYGGTVIKSSGGTVRHKPAPPSVRSIRSVEGNKKWFTVASRGIRLTARETDADFGPAHLGDEAGKLSFGVLHHFARVVSLDGTSLLLWSKVRSVSGGKAELYGENTTLAWTICLSPDLRENGVRIEVTIRPKKRLPNSSIELGPFESAGAQNLSFVETSRLGFQSASPLPGLTTYRTPFINFSPGVVIKATVTLLV